MKHLLIIALLFVAGATRAADAPPNIVVILSDDQSAPHLGCYGDKTVRTPHLDRFAAEGMRFDRAYVTAPQCVPSRASILTGRNPVSCRITRFSSPLPADVRIFPELLRERGYFTGVCGRSYHLDGSGKKAAITAAVFKERGMLTFAKRLDYVKVAGQRSEMLAQFEEFLDLAKEKPFFIQLCFSDPHRPFTAEELPHRHDPARVVVPPHLPDLPAVRTELAQYYDEVGRLDGDVGRALAALEKRGKAAETIVVFMGDNGHSFPHGKGSLYQPGIHVPLLVRWPGKVAPGSATSELVSGEDLAPTLLAACGLAAPKKTTGRSFLPQLRGEKHEGRKYVFAERGPHGSTPMGPKTKANGFDLSRSVTGPRFSLIYNCTPHMAYEPVDSGGQPLWRAVESARAAGTLAPDLARAYFTVPRPVFELFDLEKDPGELRNLAGQPQHAATERAMKEALQEWMIVNFDFLPLPLAD